MACCWVGVAACEGVWYLGVAGRAAEECQLADLETAGFEEKAVYQLSHHHGDSR